MENFFVEMISFQVRPDRIEEFESMAASMKAEMTARDGCVGVVFFKRFYTFDGVETGNPPRELTKIVKCVKYYVSWEFDTIESCGRANGWFFENYLKPVSRLLIMPFEINSGYSI